MRDEPGSIGQIEIWVLSVSAGRGILSIKTTPQWAGVGGSEISIFRRLRSFPLSLANCADVPILVNPKVAYSVKYGVHY